jgi:hypothetical protein
MLEIFSGEHPAVSPMVWYVAFIAVLNLGLGYLLAVYLGAGRPQLVSYAADAYEEPEYSDGEPDADPEA